MKKILVSLLLVSIFLIQPVGKVRASEEEHDHAEEGPEKISPTVGSGKAVTEASREKGIKLSEKALQVLGIQVRPIMGNSPFQIPAAALVYFQDEIGVYRFRGGFFTLIPVKILKKTESDITLMSGELRPGDGIAQKGVGFLRVAELEAFGGAEEGHGH